MEPISFVVEQIARMAHEINRSYCESLGDLSHPGWDDAPEWQKKSAVAGVEMHMTHPDAGPEQSHQAWMATKHEDGWIWGEVKDPEKKTHPCLIPFKDLPLEQKAKDYIFRGVVHSMLPYLENEAPAKEEPKQEEPESKQPKPKKEKKGKPKKDKK